MDSFNESLNLFKDMGVLFSHDMTMECCFAKLSYLIGKNLPHDQLKKTMSTPLRGELTSMSKKDKLYSLKNFKLIRAIEEVIINE